MNHAVVVKVPPFPSLRCPLPPNTLLPTAATVSSGEALALLTPPRLGTHFTRGIVGTTTYHHQPTASELRICTESPVTPITLTNTREVVVRDSAGSLSTSCPDEALKTIIAATHRALTSAMKHLKNEAADAAHQELQAIAPLWRPFEYWVVSLCLKKMSPALDDNSFHQLQREAEATIGAPAANAANAWANTLERYLIAHRIADANPHIKFSDRRFESAPFTE